MRPFTNMNGLLEREWYCEHCHHVFEGANPPNECEVCGSVSFENGLDIVGEGRALPVPSRPAILVG